MGPSRLVVGLGNPGAEYAGNRHNVGFRSVDRVAERYRLRFNAKRARSLVARGQLAGQDVALAKPQTYMNLSGRAVKELLVGWGVPPRSLLVVYDDVDLPPGSLRMRERGGPGTHNGMRSIVESLGSTDFPRLRIGIGSPPPMRDLADYVLDDPTPEERSLLEEALARAVEAIELFIREGPAAAMNRYNQEPRAASLGAAVE
jgi:peptidyl-tRNA hydrolase, PTH1 family